MGPDRATGRRDRHASRRSRRGRRARRPRRWANVGRIEPSYFDVLETPILAGRAFGAADLAPGANVAIVDQGFVEQVLQGRNPIGQQVRFAQDPKDPPASAPNPWIEIVGVVKELGMGSPTGEGTRRGILPSCAPRTDSTGSYMMVHGRGRSDDAGPTGSRDRGRRRSDAPPGGGGSGWTRSWTDPCGSSGCGCESRS